VLTVLHIQEGNDLHFVFSCTAYFHTPKFLDPPECLASYLHTKICACEFWVFTDCISDSLLESDTAKVGSGIPEECNSQIYVCLSRFL
jgi:hypothetical protein